MDKCLGWRKRYVEVDILHNTKIGDPESVEDGCPILGLVCDSLTVWLSSMVILGMKVDEQKKDR